MTVQKVIPKDPEKENEKYLIFLDYILDKLKNGRPAGISLRNLASDYKTEMGTTFDRGELKKIVQLYNGKYFIKVKDSIDRLIIKNESIDILNKYGDIRNFLRLKEVEENENNRNDLELFSLDNKNYNESLAKSKWTRSDIIQLIGILLVIPSLFVALIALNIISNPFGDNKQLQEQTTSPTETKKMDKSSSVLDSTNISKNDSLLNN